MKTTVSADPAWTPAALLRAVRARLAADDPATREIVRLRAIPLPNQNGRSYRGQVYLMLRDPAVQDARLQAVLPEALLGCIEPGREAILSGVLDYQAREDRITPLFCVSEVESLGEMTLPSRKDRLARYADLVQRPKRSPAAALIGERPRVAVVTALSGVALEDIRAQVRELEAEVTLVPIQASFADAGRIAEAVLHAGEQADLVVLTRGGGEGVDVIDGDRVIRAVASCPVPIITAVGHARDELVVERVADRAFPTPTAAGAWLRSVLLERIALRRKVTEAEAADRHVNLVAANQRFQVEVASLRTRADTAERRAAVQGWLVRALVVVSAALAVLVLLRW